MTRWITPIPVEPSGTRRTVAFVTLTGGKCGGLQEVELPEYPESTRGERLRQRRVSLGLSLGVLSERLGITPSQLSGLEYGRNTLSEEDWALVLDEADTREGA
jgi:hypothetical protein